MASIENAVANALAKQPWYIRRKDTITAIAGMVLQMANVLVAYTSDAPEGVSVAVAVVIGLAQAMVHAGTVGAITPSMAGRLKEAAVEAPEGEGLVDGARAAELAGTPVANPNDPHVDYHGGSHRVPEQGR